MIIRSSLIGVDEMLCAIQGYGGAYIINSIKSAALINPLNAAVCLAGVAFTEKLIYQISSRIVPGFTASLGPIPIGTKNVVSYGLATYSTLKIMQIAGLILSVPHVVTTVGAVCAVAMVAGGIYTGAILCRNYYTIEKQI